MRTGISKIKANLPLNAQKLEPLDGFPLNKKNKDLFQVRCNECLFEFVTNWDKLTNTSTTEHCCVCRYSKPAILKFNAIGYQFKITQFKYAAELDKTVNLHKTGIPKYGVLATIVHQVCGNQQVLPLNNLKNVYRKSQSVTGSKILSCEHCNLIAEQQYKKKESQRLNDSGLITQAKSIWGNAIKITPIIDGFSIDIPSLDSNFKDSNIPIEAVINPDITGRLKGPLKKNISEAMLKKFLEQDADVIQQTKELCAEAAQFGATIKYISYRGNKDNNDYIGCINTPDLPKKKDVYYKYEKATTSISNWQTRFRCQECHFGLNNVKWDQLKILCAVSELFPLNEHGHPIEWLEDSRSHFKDNKELDIKSCNFLPELGGVQIEYQGHQSHTEEGSRTNIYDGYKREEAEVNRHFFMQIDKVNHMSPETALKAVLDSIDAYTGSVKEVYLNYINPNPSVESIRNVIEKLSVERAGEITEKLITYCQNKGHILISERLLFLSSDKIEYKCGNCGTLHSTIVKTFIETDSTHCKSCKGELTKLRHIQNREKNFVAKLDKIWTSLPKNITYQLINNPIKQELICEHCHQGSRYGDSIEEVVNKLKSYNGFLCYVCLNTGEVQFTAGKKLTDYTQFRDNIVSIMKETGWGDTLKWFNFITSPKSKTEKNCTEIWLHLECNYGHEQHYSLKDWNKIVLSSKKRQKSISYCSICHPIKSGRGLPDQEHLERLERFHPNARFIGPIQYGLTPAHCGETSIIGTFKVEHPQSLVNIKKLPRNGFKKRGEFSICSCCSEEQNLAKPGGSKTLEVLNAHQKLRAAYVATALGNDSIDAAGVIAPNKAPLDEVRSDEKVFFQCHNNLHPATTSGHGNYFNPNRRGYCAICLNMLRVKNYMELIEKMRASTALLSK